MPNAADEIVDILWHSVVSVYFDSFPYAPCIPMSLRCYDTSLIPIYDMV